MTYFCELKSVDFYLFVAFVRYAEAEFKNRRHGILQTIEPIPVEINTLAHFCSSSLTMWIATAHARCLIDIVGSIEVVLTNKSTY